MEQQTNATNKSNTKKSHCLKTYFENKFLFNKPTQNLKYMSPNT